MATDYKKINIESRIDFRSIRDQRGDKTHFVYELIQNADDSKSKRLELHLCEKELLVWNDGCQFREEDVLRISSIGFSDKDLTQIGNFGTGFKAVYNYTDRPEVYSGDERFCLPDPTGISKTLGDLASSSLVEGIDKVPPRIAELVEEGKTVFRLPFKENLRQGDLTLLKGQLRELLKKRSLLFLPHLETIQWHDICDEQIGTYYRCPYGKIQSANQVELKASVNGKDPEFERFLVFSKKFQPRRDVINELLQMEYDEGRRKRIQETGEKLQPIEIAFKLQDDRITAMNSCVLSAYLPTEKETHLRFFIQARYQTNPARNDIEKTEQNPWNRWLVEETAKFLPEILEELKEAGLLEPVFFNVLPLEGEVENDFKPIAEAAKKAMREKLLVPTEDDGYAKAKNVFYPHHGSLRKLVECSWIYPNSCWLHPDIGQSGRAFDVMKEARVREINVSQVLNWLEKQDPSWFEGKCEEWLRSLYVYLSIQKSELERIKKQPLVRLENGQHVCANEQPVFFAPNTDEALEEIKPFFNDLPILQSALLDGKEGNDIKAFLDNLGVGALNPEEMISKWIMPKYRRSDRPSKEQNHLHVRYIFKVWDELLGYKHRQLKEDLSNFPILLAYKSVQPETVDFVKPCDAYLPKSYTGDTDLETYFSVSDGDIWFVNSGYLDDNSNPKEWLKFLREIGAMDTPRVDKIEVVGNYEECEKRGITRQRSTRPFEDGSDGSFKEVYYSGHYDGAIVDLDFLGLLEVFAQISNHNEVNLSRSLWSLLIKMVEPLSPEKQRWSEKLSRDAFFQCTYHRFYNRPRREFFDATFYRQLKETPWLPDEQGNLQVPSNCFAPTDDNRRVLGDSVAYLHPDLDVSQDNETARWLAEKLGIHLNANTDSVLNYLQTLSGTEVSVERVEPLYRFLDRQDARRSEEFKQKPLIFAPNPKSSWWRADKTFWDDESVVFGDGRGYLKTHYSENLQLFFKASGVRDSADPLDYVRRIQEIASVEEAEDAKVRERFKILYGRLWQSLREGYNFLESEEWQKEWNLTHEGRCWLGKKGNEWDFFFLHELVWKDDDYRSRLFKDKISFWAFDNDLLEFAKYLGVNGCYEVSDVEFNCYSDQGEDQIWSGKVQSLYPYIYDFLNSPRLCKQYREEQAAEILKRLSVHRAQRLEVRYRLNEASVSDPNPRQSFLEKKKGILWLGLEEDEEAYPDLIGDALQDDFRIDQLREFVKDLLPSVNLSKTALLSWKRRGFQADLCLSPSESDSEENEENSSESVDERLPGETGGKNNSETNNSESETPTVHEDPETGNEGSDSTGNESDTSTHRPRPGRGGARWPGGSGSSTPNRSTGTGYSGGRGEGEKHRSLKEYLAADPSLFGEGLELIDTEYRFGSGDEADILFEDSSGNPVTVEVKPPILSGSDQEAWQAVKYKHLAAVEYDLPCDEVRSILAAPEIPEDVKEKCKELGIEPIEVSNQTEA